MPFADSLQRHWYQDRPPPWWTLPIAAVYGGVIRLRRALYQHGWLRGEHLPVPVIVIGNITVGGTGKTPLTIALIEALRARGFRPGVVSRGYGGSANAPKLLDQDCDARVAGDEPALIHRRTGALVAIGRDRPAAARLLLAAGVDVILADDGLQHYALVRDIEICVIDGVRRFGNGRLLPAGPLREPRARLREIDYLVCNGGAPEAGEIAMRLDMRHVVNLRDATQARALDDFTGKRVHAVAGIGNPSRFFDTLRAHGVDVIEHPFPDHHAFVASDLAFGDDLPLLMTEKDAVKCRAFARDNWWSVPVAAELPRDFLDTIAERLHGLRR